jgi:maltooligosyltrehalose trehalohydrolase
VFFHDGNYSSFRGRSHGRPVDLLRIPSFRFLGYLQDHDQVGNRATGDRISSGLSADLVKVGAGLVLAAPFTPMLFMGEEWAASTPFQFFTSHPEQDLGKVTAEGRFAEFARMGWDPSVVPDPQDPATFARSQLDWSELETGRHAVLLDVYRRLAALRRALPELTDPAFGDLAAEADETTRVFTLRRSGLLLAVNFGERPASVAASGALLFTTPTRASVTASGLNLPPHAGALLRLDAAST